MNNDTPRIREKFPQKGMIYTMGTANRRSVLLVFALLMLVATTAFGQGAVDVKVVSDLLFEHEGVQGGRLTLALSSSPRSFNYYGVIDAAAYSVIENFLDTLVEPNPVTNEIEPALASSWEVSEDGREVIFHLREGVRWSDGVPFTAHDVVFAFEHVIMNPNAEGNARERYTLGGEPVLWEVIDDQTVKAILPQPYGAFLQVLTHALIVPKHKYEPYIAALNPGVDRGTVNRAWTTDTPVTDIVGTGPYRLKEYVVDQMVVLERNPYSWRVDPWGNQLPYTDELVYLIVQSSEVALAKFRAGEIDRMTINPQNYPALKRDELAGQPWLVLRGSPVNPTPSPPHLAFNFDIEDDELRAVFRDDRFRAAMAHAINYPRILEDVYNTLAILSGMPVLPSNQAFFNPEIENYRRGYDLDKAAAILDEMGLTVGSDGVRRLPSGRPLEFALTAPVDDGVQHDIATLLQQDLTRLGLKVHLRLLSGGLVFDSALAGDFEAIIMAFGNQPDPQLRKAIWQPGRPLYYWHLSAMDEDTLDPVLEEMFDWERRVFDLFELGEIEMDPAQRKAYYDEWQLLYAQHLPVIFIAKGMDLMVVRQDVGNVFQTEDGVIVTSNYTVYKR